MPWKRTKQTIDENGKVEAWFECTCWRLYPLAVFFCCMLAWALGGLIGLELRSGLRW